MIECIIDTHCHLNAIEHWEDALINAIKKGIIEIWIPALLPSDIEQTHKILEKYPDNIKLMCGLHPLYVLPENYIKHLKALEKYLLSNWNSWQISIIGEAGLDFKLSGYRHQQMEALKVQIEMAQYFNLPLCLHRRNCYPEFLSFLNQTTGLKLILHCFNKEDVPYLNELIKIKNLWFGINGIIKRKSEKREISKVVDKIKSQIVFETDTPYISIEDDNPPLPSQITHVIEFFSSISGIEVSEAIKLSTSNCTKILK